MKFWLAAIFGFASLGVVHAEDGDSPQVAETPQRFAVQLGKFNDEADALAWVSKLKEVGVPAFTERRTQADGSSTTLLRAGPFSSRVEASAAISKIRGAGLASSGGNMLAKNIPDEGSTKAAQQAKSDNCDAWGDKWASYARDRDAGMSLEAARKQAKAKDSKNGELFVDGVYLNPELVSMTPNEIRAMAVGACLDN